MESKLIKEQRASVLHEMKQLVDLVQGEKRSFSPEEQERFDKCDVEQKQYTEKLETLERIESFQNVRADFAMPIKRSGRISAEERENALRCVILRAAGQNVTREWADCAERCGVTNNGKNFKLSLRAQTTGTDGEGGYLTSDSSVIGLEKMLKLYGSVRNHAQILRTDHGNPLHMATNDDTANVATVVAENTTVSQTAMTFGRVNIGAFKVSTGVWPISLELLQDASVNIGALIGEALGTRFARGWNVYHTTGAGTTVPFGVVTDASTGVTTASTSAITFPEMLDLELSLDPAYRANAKFMMNDATWGHLRKHVDGEDRPLIHVDLQSGVSYRYLGYEVVINPQMASITAAAKVALFGDFSKFLVREVADVDIHVLNELYIVDGSIGFIGFARGDSKLLNTSAVKKLVMHA